MAEFSEPLNHDANYSGMYEWARVKLSGLYCTATKKRPCCVNYVLCSFITGTHFAALHHEKIRWLQALASRLKWTMTLHNLGWVYFDLGELIFRSLTRIGCWDLILGTYTVIIQYSGARIIRTKIRKNSCELSRTSKLSINWSQCEVCSCAN